MKHKVGDIVTIREWDDMAREFGLDENGDINIPGFRFTKDMKKCCGMPAKINVAFLGNYKMKNFGKWIFDDCMFTDWEPKKEYEGGMGIQNHLDGLGEEIKKSRKKALSDAEIPTISDSGDRTVFPTGAVRDMHAGKGRMDLLPFYAILEFSKHGENGAVKYGEHNVDKGIPQHSLIDSAIRHLFKHCAGETDEDHLLAAFWNLGWAVNQRTTHPELIDVPWKDDNK